MLGTEMAVHFRFANLLQGVTASRTENTAPDRSYMVTVGYRFERRGGAWVLMPTRGHG